MAGGAIVNTGASKDYPGKLTIFVFFTCVVAATGGLIFGYDIGISGGVTSMDSFLKKFFPAVYRKEEEDHCKFHSLYLAALIASFFASSVTRMFGSGITFLVGAALNGFARSVAMLIIGRILLGIGVGFANQEAMEKAIKNKVAKAVVPAIDVMFQALSEFGAKVVPPKKILKMLPELFDHQDQNVRASSKGLTLELCRWIGKEPVKSILFEKMQDTMKKELEAELANVTGIAKPTRKIRSEQDKEPVQEAVTEATGAGAPIESLADAPQEIDEYELLDPIDILTPLEKSGFWDGVKATKWSERRDAVAELTKLASTKRIAHGDFTEIRRTLKKLVTDVNLAVSVEAIQAIGNLARGLRNHFAASSCFVLPVLLENLKEKRPALTKALIHTLQAMHQSGCLTLGDVIKDVRVAVKNKVPLVRSLTLNWVTFCIETSTKAVVLKLHKDYVPICMECLNDGTPDVRDASFAALAAIAKMVGMRPLEKSLEKLDDVRKKKLSEMIGNAGGGVVTDSGSALVSTSSGKNSGYEGFAAAPKKIVKALDSTSSTSAAGFDGLPREDVSAKITPNLLKNLGSPDWKVRLESIDSVNKMLEEAHKRIQPAGTGELFAALRGRLYDSNKNLVMVTLSTIGGLASALGFPVEKSSKGILADVLKCLGDNKKNLRECTLNALDSWFGAVQLDKMVPYITVALAEPKLGADGRKDLFDWLSRHLAKINDSSAALHLLKPAASALLDKSAEVRKAAESCLGEILNVCGQEAVTKNLKDLKGPALALILERLKLSGLPEEALDSTKMISTGLKSSTRNAKPGSNSFGDRGSKHGGKAISLRGVPTRALKLDAIASVQDLAVQSQALFNIKDSNKEDKERYVVRRFKFEEPRPEQIQDLECDFMKHFREDLHRRLLSVDFKKQVDGLELLQKALPSSVKEIIELLDIILRWFVLRFCKSNTTCLLKVLEFLPELFDALKDEGYILSESEAAMFLPCLVEKAGHNIEKVREKMRELMKRVLTIYSASKILPYILEGLHSKNNRTRIECVDLVGYLIDHHGAEISGQVKSLQLVAGLTSERYGEIRKAALNTMATAYKNLGEDVWRYVGKLSDAQKSMLDDRFKWKAREMDKRKEGKPGEARAALRRSVRENRREGPIKKAVGACGCQLCKSERLPCSIRQAAKSAQA